jgi:hypothetical protein
VRFCHACDCQFPDEDEVCLHCGARLHAAPSAPSAGGDDEDPSAGYVLLTVLDPFEAPRLLDRLAEAGIPFAVLSDQSAQARVALHGRRGATVGVNVFVPPEERERASELQQQVLRESLPDLSPDFDASAGGADVCPACSSPLSGDAASCSECGLEFPDVEA